MTLQNVEKELSMQLKQVQIGMAVSGRLSRHRHAFILWVFYGYARRAEGTNRFRRSDSGRLKAFRRKARIGSICFVFQFQPLRKLVWEMGTQQR